MKQSIFRKHLNETGKVASLSGEIIATMNYGSKLIQGTHAFTHDDYSKTVPIHKVEIFIEGKLILSKPELISERQVLEESKFLLDKLKQDLIFLANNEPKKTFAAEMEELFK